MKRILLTLIVLFCLGTTPTLAATDDLTVTLNGLSYSPKTTILTKDETYYISATDFAHLFFATLEQTEQNYTIDAPIGKMSFSPRSTLMKFNDKTQVLSKTTFIQNNELYVPLDTINLVGGTLTSVGNSIKLTTPVPYSRNSDNANTHTYKEIKANLKTIPSHIIGFSSADAFVDALQEAKLTKSYIAYLSNTLLKDTLSEFKSKLVRSPYNNMYVSFRTLDTIVAPNQVGEVKTYPLSAEVTNDSIELQFGDENLSLNAMWSTYYPAKSLDHVDLTKSAEMTIMRGLYEYYRNTYDLRDDLYFSPFATINSERTNVMSHEAYSLSHDGKMSHYMVNVYRVHPSGQIHYIVDIAPLEPSKIVRP